jgi:hypothetical protein
MILVLHIRLKGICDHAPFFVSSSAISTHDFVHFKTIRDHDFLALCTINQLQPPSTILSLRMPFALCYLLGLDLPILILKGDQIPPMPYRPPRTSH